jgi:AhpD family alkylhydroperoxidase
VKIREQIALAVAEANGCDYCLAAHTAVGKAIGLTPEQIRDSRLGGGVDGKTDALVKFARRMVDARGKVSDADLVAVRSAGWGDRAIAEVVANVALHVFTNYFNTVADIALDFPPAPALTPEPTAA